MRELIEVKTIIDEDIELVWDCWTNPKHIVNWYFSSDTWHTPKANQNFTENGKFSFRMEAKDGSMGFDFAGRYIKIEEYKLIRYLLQDSRRVDVKFKEADGKVILTEDFEAESKHTVEIERIGWQSILDNFKKYIEGLNKNIS